MDILFHCKSKFKGCGLYTGAGYTPNLKTYSSYFGGCGLYTDAGNTPVITVVLFNICMILINFSILCVVENKGH